MRREENFDNDLELGQEAMNAIISDSLSRSELSDGIFLTVCAFSPATRLHIHRVWFISHHLHRRPDPTPERERNSTQRYSKVDFFFYHIKCEKESFRRILLILYKSRNDAAKKIFSLCRPSLTISLSFHFFFFLSVFLRIHFSFFIKKKKTKKSSLLAFLFLQLRANSGAFTTFTRQV